MVFKDSGALGRPNWSILLIFHRFYKYLVDTDFGHAGAARPATRAAFTFALNYCPFLNIRVSARQDFDSGGGFKGKVGAEDDVVGKVHKEDFRNALIP